jgi:TatD DNase family protein
MIDVHCHLDLYPNPEEIAQEIESKQIITIAVTNIPSHFVFSTPHVRLYKNVHLALGMHPLVAESHTAEELKKFKEAAKQTLFIGEIGLDFSVHGKETTTQQVHTFEEVLRVIQDRPRFVSIHSRGAEDKIDELLSQYEVRKCVFHWYSGPISVLRKIIENGHYASVNPSMVKSKNGQKIIDQLPKDRVMTETDGPYVRIGSRLAKPSDVASVLKYLSQVWGIALDEVESQIAENFHGILDSVQSSPQ